MHSISLQVGRSKQVMASTLLIVQCSFYIVHRAGNKINPVNTHLTPPFKHSHTTSLTTLSPPPLNAISPPFLTPSPHTLLLCSGRHERLHIPSHQASPPHHFTLSLPPPPRITPSQGPLSSHTHPSHHPPLMPRTPPKATYSSSPSLRDSKTPSYQTALPFANHLTHSMCHKVLTN